MKSKLLLFTFILLISFARNYALSPLKLANSYSIIPVPPTVTTSVSSTYTSAQLGGNVTSGGTSSVTERGVVYGLATAPTTADTKLSNGFGTGVFTQAVSGLATSTKYFVRAYAINSAGTSYGSEVSFTTAAFCGGNILGSGYISPPTSTSSAIDGNWKVVILPQGYSPTEALPFNAHVPKTEALASTYLNRSGYTVAGSTYYWIAPKFDASSLLGEGVSYNWIVQQTFTVAQSGFYDLNFSGMGDNAITFYINGVIDSTDPVKPTITGGTQIGGRHDSFTALGTFDGVTYLNAGVNTASMVMEDWGGATTALISGSTFTCNTSYININPSISGISDTSIIEGTTPPPIVFTVNDPETPLNNLTVAASSSNTALIPNGNISLQGNTGSRTISLTPVLGETGATTITITLDDNAGGVVTKTFVATIDELSLNKYGQYVSDPTQAVDMYGGVGTGFGLKQSGKKIIKLLPLKIGDAYQGGIIFYTYIDVSGVTHGLIASTADQAVATWDNRLTTAAAYTGGGYTDWRLPHTSDYIKMYNQRNLPGLVGTFKTNYWPSNNFRPDDYKSVFSFTDGTDYSQYRYYDASIRAIRSF